jgi:hypothetical protein
MSERSGSDEVPPPSPPPPGDSQPAEPTPLEAEAPPRRRTGIVVAIVVLVLLVAGAAAFFLLGGGKPAIETPEGRLLVDSAQLTDSWPEGCEPSPTDPSCLAPQPGYRLLAVVIVPEEEPEGDILDEDAPSPDTDRTYVTDSTGARLEVAATSFDIGGARWVLIFTPSTSASGFVLHYPDNEPIELEA